MFIAIAAGVMDPAVGLHNHTFADPAVETSNSTWMPVCHVAGSATELDQVRVELVVSPLTDTVDCAWHVPAATAVPLVVTCCVPELMSGLFTLTKFVPFET